PRRRATLRRRGTARGAVNDPEGRMRRLLLVTAAAVIAGAGARAPAQDANTPFFRGKQINFIVGSSAGGGYDIYARLLARHMSKYIPRNPITLASNMPGPP